MPDPNPFSWPIVAAVALTGASLLAQQVGPPSVGAKVAGKKAQDPTIPGHQKIRTLKSGVQIALLQKMQVRGGGQPLTPRYGDRVKLHMTTWLESGKFIESTRDRKPVWQIVGYQMVQGLALGLCEMQSGNRYKLIVPSKLAFAGQAGIKSGVKQRQVPAQANLVYEISLFEVSATAWRLPRFQAVPEAKLKPLSQGLRYAVLAPGNKSYPDDARLRFDFSVYNAHGMLLDSNLLGKGRKPLDEKAGLTFLELIASRMRSGAKVRFVVPPELCYGQVSKGPLLPPNSLTYWDLQVAAVRTPMPVPDFQRLVPGQARSLGGGLRYQVVQPGKGRKPGAMDSVRVHFAGWRLRDRHCFESSYGAGEAAILDLRSTLSGLQRALTQMPQGAVWLISVPGHLGYGVAGRKSLGIGPGETLVFRVELLEVLRS